MFLISFSRRVCVLAAVVFTLFGLCGARGAVDSAVVFNEIQYFPPSGGTEWVELHSLHGVTVDLSGWKISGGIDFAFPAGTTIPGHGFLIVAANPAAMPSALGPFTGQLSNSGDTLKLVNRNGRVMDEVSYSDGGSWPAGATGSGATLVKVNQESAESTGSQWTASPELGGSPGVANFPIPGQAPTATTLVALGTSWKYRDDNIAQPAGWNTTGFDDSAWASGGALLYAGNPNISGAGEGLYGYWPLDETSGTTAANLAAGGSAATLNGGLSFVADGTRNRVLNCGGSSGAYASAGSLPQMTLTNNFTWSFWANSATSGGTSVVLGNRYSSTGVDFSPREFIKFTPSSFEYHRNAAAENVAYSSAFPTNTWVHHAVVKQGASLTYYRNGVASGSTTITQGQNNGQPFYFGGDKAGENWSGKLDDIAVWTKALPSSSISGLANNSLTPLTAPTGTSSATLATAVAVGPRTHYFRKAFTFAGAKERTTLTLQHMVDDGAVIYLNGVEVFRVNMPVGAITHSTAASSNISSTALSSAITIPSDALIKGTNVLAVEVHQFDTASPNNDMAFGASLSASEAPAPPRYPGTGVVFNEISAAGAGFQLELLNSSAATVDLTGYKIVSSTGANATLQAQSVAPGAVVTYSAAQLGFTPASGDRLFLVQPNGTSFEDAQKVTGKLRGRAPNGQWLFPSAPSFGGSNTFSFNNSVVINEIMYSPMAGQVAQEKWIEIYNRSANPVSVAGWKFSDGISYTFPAGTTIGAGQYVVITDDTAAFAQHHAGVTALGPFTGKLSSKGEHLELDDATGNPVDEVRFSGGGRWPEAANSGGSSLERQDPRADSNAPEAWKASDESARGSWQTFSWSGLAANLNGDPTQWNEFICGLLDSGTFLLDDVSVKDLTAGNVELIQNGGFETGTAATWRLLGTHRNATVVTDPSGSGKVLKVVATGATEHMHNHLETTLKSTSGYVTLDATHNYAISFRARWMSGSNQLNARLYFNRLADTKLLPVAPGGGTPGAPNTTAVANIGPTFSKVVHSPAVPAAGQAVTVSATATDPDGVANVSLLYSVNGAGFSSASMTLQGGSYTGTIPGQAAGTKVQFYLQASDGAALSTFPRAGAASRALVQWDDGQARLTQNGVSPNNIRIIMTDADAAFLHSFTNVMSNDRLGCTVVYNEREVFYDCGVKLKGSEHGRDQDSRVSFNIEFPRNQLFLGAHRTIAVDRSGAGNQYSQKEILVKHAITAAGGIPGSEDDLCRVIAPLSKHTGSAILVKERYDSAYLSNQYDNGDDGRMFKFEYIYYPYTTTGVDASPGNTGAAVENLKYPEPDNVVTSVSMRNLGPGKKELHRWHWLIQDNEELDDYSGLMTWLTAFGRSSTADAQYFADAAAMMDVDEWLRCFAVEHLFGIGDNYGGGTVYHNAIVYQRPTDGRWMFFPHDMDFTFSSATNSSFVANADLQKLVSSPTYARMYYGHLLDLCTRVYSSAYLLPWAQHYSKFVSEDLTSYMSYIDSRRSTAISAISAAVPQTNFAITTGGGQPVTVNSSFVTIQGTGWVDVRDIRVAGTTQPLTVTWDANKTSWTVTIAVPTGTQTITLEAIGYDGSVVHTASITVTNTSTNTWAPLRINEWLASNHSYLDPADSSADDWLELYNPTSSPVSLASWTLSDSSVTYTIPAGYTVPAGGFLLVWADNQTYQNTGGGQLHVPFQISANGDTLKLRAPDATVIDSVTFGLQTSDVSEGRFPDGSDKVQALTAPSPQARNILTTSSITRTGTNITFTFTTTPGAKYQVEGSNDLVTWQPLGAVQTAVGNSITVQEDVGATQKRFYRVRVDP